MNPVRRAMSIASSLDPAPIVAKMRVRWFFSVPALIVRLGATEALGQEPGRAGVQNPLDVIGSVDPRQQEHLCLG